MIAFCAIFAAGVLLCFFNPWSGEASDKDISDIVAPGNGGQAGKALLKWKFTKGRKLVYRVQQKGSGSGVGKSESSHDAELEVTFLCPEEGQALVTISFKNLVGGDAPKLSRAEMDVMSVVTIAYDDGKWIAELDRKQKNLVLMLFPLPGKSCGAGYSWDPGIRLMSAGSLGEDSNRSEAKVESVSRRDGTDIAIIRVEADGRMTVGGSASTMEMAGKAQFDVARGCHVSGTFKGGMRRGGRDKPLTQQSVTELSLQEDSMLGADQIATAAADIKVWRLVYQALRMVENDKREAAVKAIQKALEHKPSHAKANLVLLQLYGQQGDFDRMIECLRREKRFRPSGPLTKNLVQKVLMAIKLSDLSDAEKRKLENAIKKVFPEYTK